jgi:hypothetical protein
MKKIALAALLAALPTSSLFATAANYYGIRYDNTESATGISRAGSYLAFAASLNSKALSTTIHRLDAAFIKVYFDHVNLPAGWQLEVRSTDGKERYVYGSVKQADESLADFTFDPAMGQNGKSSFAAMSISGDSATVQLIPPASAELEKAQPQIEISHILEGYPDAVIEQLKGSDLLATGGEGIQSICSTDNKQRPACYSGNAFTRSKAVARMILGGGGSCTAWRIGSGDKVMSNNHCASSNSAVTGSEIWFDYQHSACSGSTTKAVKKVSGRAMLKTSAALDYVLFTVNNASTISEYGFLSIDPRMPVNAEQIYIPQHPGGRLKELAINSTSDTGGKCKVFNSQVGNDFTYHCDTEPGSSGSPVLASNSNKVIGLHHLGGCPNSAVRISRVWQEIGSFFNNQAP